jgi:predicted transcriptional regulator
MKLRTYKRDTRKNVAEIAEMFGVTNRTVYNWLDADASIRGMAGQRVIVIQRVAAREAHQ